MRSFANDFDAPISYEDDHIISQRQAVHLRDTRDRSTWVSYRVPVSHGFVDAGCSRANAENNRNAVGPPQHFFHRRVFRLEARADIDAAARQ